VNQGNAGSDDQLICRLETLSDESLVASAQSGLHLAYDELCRRHSIKTFRTVQRITRNREDAEDALQDSLLKGFTYLKRFDGRSTFSTWLTRIAINSALMILRKKRRSDHEISFEGDASHYLQIPDPSSDQEQYFFEGERGCALWKAVRGLPPLLRGVTEARYLQEASVSDVAALAGVSVAATKTRLLRAKKSLRHALSENGTSHRCVRK
jgi:RNA polymerase sigma factor (sigma-70 family)